MTIPITFPNFVLLTSFVAKFQQLLLLLIIFIQDFELLLAIPHILKLRLIDVLHFLGLI
jgi:hypothetical protein